MLRVTQRELFVDLPAAGPQPGKSPFPLFPGRFLRVKVAYEDMIFGGLGLILLLLGGFCLGVERGKGLVVRHPVLEPPSGVSSTVAHAAARPGPEWGSASPVLPIIPAAVSPPPPEAFSGGRADPGMYAIQLASYVGQQSAQEEARRLARQGVSARVVRQRKYYEVRAVGFRSWAQAKEALTDLRKTYRDAFIKRLAPSGG